MVENISEKRIHLTRVRERDDMTATGDDLVWVCVFQRQSPVAIAMQVVDRALRNGSRRPVQYPRQRPFEDSRI